MKQILLFTEVEIKIVHMGKRFRKDWSLTWGERATWSRLKHLKISEKTRSRDCVQCECLCSAVKKCREVCSLSAFTCCPLDSIGRSRLDWAQIERVLRRNGWERKPIFQKYGPESGQIDILLCSSSSAIQITTWLGLTSAKRIGPALFYEYLFQEVTGLVSVENTSLESTFSAT